MKFSTCSVFLCLVLAGQVSQNVRASLFAVDLGGESLKVSVVKPGRTPISIVINEMSRRKTPVLSGFLNGERVVGEEAVTMINRHPDKIFGRLRDMLGKEASDPAVRTMLEESNLHYDIVEDPVRKSIRLKLPDTGKEYSIEELVAGVLAYAHRITMDYSGSDIRDVVIVIPPFFSPAARQALLDSAEMAGLNVLSLMHSHSAAALQHGIEKQYTNKTESVVLYDVGATSIVAALVKYSSYPESRSSKAKHLSQFEVVDVSWSEGVGALQLDTILLKHFAGQFVKQYGTIDITTVPKAVSKMSKPVRRTKEMLSANHEAPFHVQELFEDHDFASSISRSDFEDLAGTYWDTMKKPLVELITRNDLKADGFTVQLLGGGSRVPRTRASLLSVLPDIKLEKQLDADEAVALGAGLYAANKSTMFRLRQFGMRDGQVFPVRITIDDISAGGIPASAMKYSADQGGELLMPYMKKLESRRKVTLTDVTADPLVVTLSLDGEIGSPRMPSGLSTNKLVTYKLTGLKDTMKRYSETGKVGLHFEADSNGLVTLSKAEAVIDYEAEIMVDKEVPDEEGQAKADIANKAADEKDAADEVERQKKRDEEKLAKQKQDEEDEANGKEYSEDEKIKKEKALKKKAEKQVREAERIAAAKEKRERPVMKKIKVPKMTTKTRVVSLKPVGTHVHGVQPMTAPQKKESMALLSDLTKKEVAKALSARTKNELEAYIIAMKADLEENEDIIKVSTEEQRDALRADLTESEDWLYMDDEADEADASVYTARLKSLRVNGDKMEIRARELARRDERMSGARKLINLIELASNSWPETKTWLDEKIIKKLIDQTNEFKEWLDKGAAAQEKLALHEDPAYLIEDLQTRFEGVSKAFNKLNNTSAPKPPPTKSAGKEGDDKTENKDKTEAESDKDATNSTNADPTIPHDEL